MASTHPSSPAHASLVPSGSTALGNAPTPPHSTHRTGLLQLAQAFEGIAGAAQEHAFAPSELQEATRVAEQLWDANGPEWHASDLKAARADLLANADAAARGEPHAAAIVERAAHRIARDLHWRAHAVPDAHGHVGFEVRSMIRHLDARFARFAFQAVPAPM